MLTCCLCCSWEVQGEVGGKWTVLANGSSVGNKWITLLESNVTVTALKATVTASAPGGTGKIRATSGHLCVSTHKLTLHGGTRMHPRLWISRTSL